MKTLYIVTILLILFLLSTFTGSAQLPFAKEIVKTWQLKDVVQQHAVFSSPSVFREFGSQDYESGMSFELSYTFDEYSCTRKMIKSDSPFLIREGIKDADTATIIYKWQISNDSLSLYIEDRIVFKFKVHKLTPTEMVLSEQFKDPFTGLLNRRFYYFVDYQSFGYYSALKLLDNKSWYNWEMSIEDMWQEDTIKLYNEIPEERKYEVNILFNMVYEPFSRTYLSTVQWQLSSTHERHEITESRSHALCPGSEINTVMFYLNDEWVKYLLVTSDDKHLSKVPKEGERWLIRF